MTWKYLFEKNINSDSNMMDAWICASLCPSMINGGVDTRVKPEYDKKEISSLNTYPLSSLGIEQENTTLLSSSGIGQERTVSLSIGENTAPLSSSDLIRRSTENKGNISSNNLSKKQKHDAHSAILPHKNNHNPNNLPQQKGYNITLNNPSQAKRHNTNPTNSPKQKGHNMTQNKLLQHKGYNMTQTNFSQSGRSMVEMLGTLAIIGVLSVGGIMGYSYGMDKWRANETINDVILRSVDIVTWVDKSQNLNGSQWPEKNPAGYEVSFVDDGEGNIGIQVLNVPSRICKIVGDALETSAQVYVNDDESRTLDDPCDLSEKNTMIFFFDPILMTECDVECADDEVCVWGQCVSARLEISSKWPTDRTCESNADCAPCGTCQSGVCSPKNDRICNTDTVTGGICRWGECLPRGCNESNPCTGDKEYCSSPNGSCAEPFPDEATGTCVKPDFKPFMIDGKRYWVSNTTLSFWDAQAACKALGKTLTSVSDFVTGWAQKYGTYTRTAFAEKLYDEVWLNSVDPSINPSMWTTDDFGNSCYMWIVYLRNGLTTYHDRRGYYTNFHSMAVCK